MASTAAAKHCDIVTVNLYYPPEKIGSYKLPGLSADKVPLLIGEFHFGTRSRGFSYGLRGADTDKERDLMVKKYLEGVKKHPAFVGAHWFQMYDQPVTGRSHDGENYNVGLLDITDSPYKTLIKVFQDFMSNQ